MTTTKGEMKFLNWSEGVSRFSVTIGGKDEEWVFVDRDTKGAELLNEGGLTVAESVDLRPAWRRWLSLLGPVEFRTPEGEVLCRLERKGWSSKFQYTIGKVRQILHVEMQFTQTLFKSKGLLISMTESENTVASFECVPSVDPIGAMLVTAQLVASFHRA